MTEILSMMQSSMILAESVVLIHDWRNAVHPAFVLLIGALLMTFIPMKGRQWLGVIIPLIAFGLVWNLPANAYLSIHMVGHDFVLLRMNEMARMYAIAFTLFGAICGLYAWIMENPWEKMTTLYLTAGGVGVVLCGDLLTLYFFWEILTIASMILVWFGKEKESLKAAFRYVIMHLGGGLCLLAGSLLLIGNGHSGGIEAIELSNWASWLLLIGMLVNAAVPPLHAWMPDAYPRASIFGTVFLATFTTKAAVYVMSQVFEGTSVLVWLGAIMALYGGIFAVLENNMRRLLSYHIASQVGFIVCAIGVGGHLALNGATALAVTNIFYKGLLMMSAGAIIYAVGSGKLSDLGQLGKSMKLTFILCVIGGLSISGAPFLNGFISKGLTMSAVKEYSGTIELMLSVASVVTFLSVGLKLPYFAFMGPDHGAVVKRPVPKSMLTAMSVTALLCILTGIFPHLLYYFLPYKDVYQIKNPNYYFTFGEITKSLHLMAATTVGFWVLIKIVAPKAYISLDLDRIYRYLVPTIVGTLGYWIDTAGAKWDTFIRARVSEGVIAMHTMKENADRNALAYSISIVLGVIAVLAWLAWLARL